jgi:hypothetical protein
MLSCCNFFEAARCSWVATAYRYDFIFLSFDMMRSFAIRSLILTQPTLSRYFYTYFFCVAFGHPRVFKFALSLGNMCLPVRSPLVAFFES